MSVKRLQVLSKSLIFIFFVSTAYLIAKLTLEGKDSTRERNLFLGFGLNSLFNIELCLVTRHYFDFDEGIQATSFAYNLDFCPQ